MCVVRFFFFAWSGYEREREREKSQPRGGVRVCVSVLRARKRALLRNQKMRKNGVAGWWWRGDLGLHHTRSVLRLITQKTLALRHPPFLFLVAAPAPVPPSAFLVAAVPLGSAAAAPPPAGSACPPPSPPSTAAAVDVVTPSRAAATRPRASAVSSPRSCGENGQGIRGGAGESVWWRVL